MKLRSFAIRSLELSATPVNSVTSVTELSYRNFVASSVRLCFIHTHPQVFRDAAGVYDGRVVSIPYTTEVPLLFWRRYDGVDPLAPRYPVSCT